MRDNLSHFPAAGRGVMGSLQLDQVTPDHLYCTNPASRWERQQLPCSGIGRKHSLSDCLGSAHKGCAHKRGVGLGEPQLPALRVSHRGWKWDLQHQEWDHGIREWDGNGRERCLQPTKGEAGALHVPK